MMRLKEREREERVKELEMHKCSKVRLMRKGVEWRFSSVEKFE